MRAIDQIKHLLQIGDLTDAGDIANQQAFIKRIQEISNQEGSTSTASVGGSNEEQIAESDGSKTFLISIKPNEDILRNGTNPFYLLDDLHAMGDAKVVAFAKEIPELTQFKPITNYTQWQVVLNTSESINEIKDVFIFVEDECEIDLQELKVNNVINSNALVALIDKAVADRVLITKEQIEEIGDAGNGKEDDKKDAKRKVQLKEHKISSIRVNSNKIDDLVNLVSELVTIQAQLNLYAEKRRK